MTMFPAAVHHVALTVTDLAASRAWYRRLLGAEPVVDEDVPALPGHHKGFHHTIFVLPGGVILALHAHAGTDGAHGSTSFGPAWTTSASAAATAPSWSGCGPAWTSSESGTAASPRTNSATACRSAIPTTSPWSSGRLGPDTPTAHDRRFR